MRRRELSRWRSGKWGGRTLINTRDKAAVDLAGFNADEPRDERGRWTKEGSAQARSRALRTTKAPESPSHPVTAPPTGIDPAHQRLLSEVNAQIIALNQRLGSGDIEPKDYNSQLDQLNAKRNLLRTPQGIGVTPGGVIYPTSAEGKAKIDAYNQAQRNQQIGQMGVTDRLKEVFERLIESGKFSDAVVSQLKQMMSWKNLALLGAIAGSQAVPGVGEAVDAVMYCLMGKQVLDVSGDVAGGLEEAITAKTDRDFDEAAGKLADGLSQAAIAAGMVVGGYAAGKGLEAAGKALKPVGEVLASKLAARCGHRWQRQRLRFAEEDMVPVGDEPANNIEPEVPDLRDESEASKAANSDSKTAKSNTTDTAAPDEPTSGKETDSGSTSGRAQLKPGKRLPVSDGEWTGKPGNSGWKSYRSDINAITQGEPIPYENGYPDYSKWEVDHVQIDMKGTRVDATAADAKLAEKRNWASAKDAEAFRRANKLQWHHVEYGKTMQLIPKALNDIPHQGGAAIARETQ